MKRLLFTLALLLAGGIGGAELYRNDFTKPLALPMYAARLSEAGMNFLRVSVPESDSRGRKTVRIPFDLAACRGQYLTLLCRVRAKNVSKPPAYYNGVKVMLGFRSEGRMQWKNPFRLWGDFDWKTVSTSFPVPEDATEGVLHLGLEDSSGEADFTRLVIEAKREEELYPPPAPLPEGFQAEYTPRVTGTPRLRGMMSPTIYRKGDPDDLAAWGANLIRWQMRRNWGKVGTDRELAEYNAWIDRKLDEFEQVLADCERLGLKVVLDLHTPPGGLAADKDMAMFYEPEYAEAFLEIWRKIARRFKGHPAIFGYDLINEPKQRRPARCDYLKLQYLAALAIREIDPEVPVIVESNLAANADTFRQLRPLPLKDVIYEVHMYKPLVYTHQNIDDGSGPAPAYPGLINGVLYNRERLRHDLEPVRAFQQKYGARIYAGEFSAARWAKGAARYLEDCIALFEEYGWDWSYHAFRESKTWDVEYESGGDRRNATRATEDSDRKSALRNGFRLNRP